MYISRLGPVLHGRYLAWVSTDPIFPDKLAQKSNAPFREFTFLTIKRNFFLLEPKQDSLKPFVILCLIGPIRDSYVHLAFNTGQAL